VHSASFVELGNGKRAKFWTDRWLPCHRSIMEAFPILASYVRVSGISVAEALVGNRWIRDVRGGVSTQAINQYLHLWDLTSSVHLVATSEDRLIWRHTEDGQFSTSSAYSLFFAANTRFPCASAIWKSKAPARCKFFMWLVVHKRCLTADNLQKRGWPHSSTCRLCLRAPESCTHLFVHCPFAIAVWHRLKAWSKAMFIIPGPTLLDTEDWWLRTRKQVPKKHRRDFDTVTILLHWKIWKERNSRIFDDQAHTVDEVFDSIRDDIAMWRSAGLVLSS
jgi:hypothetical protein